MPNTFELSTSTTNLASYLRANHRLDKNGSLLSLSGVKEITQPLTVQLDSSQSTLPGLFKLLFEEKYLLGIQELVKLLGFFVHVITIMGSDHYPTFSIMLLLIKILQDHLFKQEMILKHPIVHD
ncbi:23983_t:CDS:2, partial [Gigaspora rosea]